jgi:hypothetical protein
MHKAVAVYHDSAMRVTSAILKHDQVTWKKFSIVWYAVRKPLYNPNEPFLATVKMPVRWIWFWFKRVYYTSLSVHTDQQHATVNADSAQPLSMHVWCA